MSIEERLNRLEQANNRWRFASLLLITCVGLCSFLFSCSDRYPAGEGSVSAQSGAAPGPVQVEAIRTRKLQIVDSEGRVAITLGTDRGTPQLSMISDNGGIMLWVQDDGGSLTITKDRKQELSLGSLGREGGGGYVTVFNAFGKAAASISAGKNNCGVVVVHDFNGKAVQGLSGGR